MESNELLDAVKARLKRPSDYALSKKLGVTQEGIRAMRIRGLSDERAIQIAELLGIQPEKVLADIHAERAKNPKVKKIWEKIARSMATAASILIATCALFLISSYIDIAQASDLIVNQSCGVSAIYIMSNGGFLPLFAEYLTASLSTLCARFHRPPRDPRSATDGAQFRGHAIPMPSRIAISV